MLLSLILTLATAIPAIPTLQEMQAMQALQTTPAPHTASDWYKPRLSATWQWQLQENNAGELNLDYVVDIYDIDLFDAPDSAFHRLHAEGRNIICYFSAGSWEEWREDAHDFPADVLGKTLDGWKDERWLDIRSSYVRDHMRQRIALAQARGCDAVEPDNVHAYLEDTGFNFTATEQLEYNRFLAETAHGHGLAIGLKNDLPQLEQLVDSFDFAVNEQCFEYGECAAYTVFIAAGKPVFSAEYAAKYRRTTTRQRLCEEARALGLQTLVLPLDLDDSFRFACN